MTSETEIVLVLTNKKGLHARAAAKFVKVASQFDAKLIVSKIAGAGVMAGQPPLQSSGASILGLMMLGAECGAVLNLSATGIQAFQAADAIKKLINERFGED